MTEVRLVPMSAEQAKGLRAAAELIWGEFAGPRGLIGEDAKASVDACESIADAYENGTTAEDVA